MATMYNVHCIACDAVYTPGHQTPLWWKAQQREKRGLIDALPVSGEECGCVKRLHKPDAPFRVFGFDDLCRDFDAPFTNFTSAVAQYLKMKRANGYTVFIDGVTDTVRERLACL